MIKRFSIIIYKLNRVLIEAIYIVKVFFKPKDLKPHNYFLKSQFCFYNFIISIIMYLFNTPAKRIHVYLFQESATHKRKDL